MTWRRCRHGDVVDILHNHPHLKQKHVCRDEKAEEKASVALYFRGAVHDLEERRPADKLLRKKQIHLAEEDGGWW